MICPVCGCQELKVIDSRPSDNNTIKRRRECENCKSRYTTYEAIESYQLMVVKKNGERQTFDKPKMLAGIVKACHKRPVDAEAIASQIEIELHNTYPREVTSTQIGECVMRKLRDIDEVAYVRFVSVYRDFNDVDSFMKELYLLKEDPK
jgi:transcriptional repressor NrdR